MKVYKIKDNKTGLYHSGGGGERWDKNGKTWSSLGRLKNHFSYFREYTKPDQYFKALQSNDWTIEEYELSTVFSKSSTMKEFIDDWKKSKK